MAEKKCNNKCKIKMIDSESSYGFVNELSEKGGRFLTTTYSVFSGIELIYNDAHIMSVESKATLHRVILLSDARRKNLRQHIFRSVIITA